MRSKPWPPTSSGWQRGKALSRKPRPRQSRKEARCQAIRVLDYLYTTQAGEGPPVPAETVLTPDGEPDPTLWAKAEVLIAQQMTELVAAGKELPKQLETGADP
jgi:hypothetical protein